MEQIENEVYQAMAVMDKETGQLLNYKQLLRSAKYKKQWSISLDNKFGRLANGIDNRIKNPTNTIKFIRKKDIPQDLVFDDDFFWYVVDADAYELGSFQRCHKVEIRYVDRHESRSLG